MNANLKELTRPTCTCGGYWNGKYWEHANDCRDIDEEDWDWT